MSRALGAPPAPRPLLASLAVAGALLAGPAPARADEGRTFQVTVRPDGQPWSVGGYGGRDCQPTCVIHLQAKQHPMAIGGATGTLYLAGPVDISYRPGSRALRWMGGGMSLLGALAGGIMVYVAAKACVVEAGSPPTPCGGATLTRAAVRGLVTSATVAFSAAVAGGFLFALSSESIRVDDVPEPPRSPLGVTWRPIAGGFPAGAGPALHGATLELRVRF